MDSASPPHTESTLSEAVRRYLAHETNRAHFQRVQELPTDGAAYAEGLIALRRDEIAEWRRTWWTRLGRHPARILDAGCGPGFVSAALADVLPHSEVVGIDVESEGIAVARALASGRPNLDAFRASLEQLPDGVDRFDLIICRTTLEHVYDPRLALSQLISALAPGGALFLETPNYLFPFEPHVRLVMPPKCPKPLLRLECRTFGRDPGFVDHLQFACDPLTLARWAKASGSEQVTDLMAEKAVEILLGREQPVVGSRARFVRPLATVARAYPRLAQRFARLPIWPSVQLLIFAPPFASRMPTASYSEQLLP